uniref:Uncharacterized protein n=1 Tax=Mycena chlorophos TaxID=658473 RepID=A0ABQ0LE93_MYCCL|nr:predicted protein [Mycena chlorophos]
MPPPMVVGSTVRRTPETMILDLKDDDSENMNSRDDDRVVATGTGAFGVDDSEESTLRLETFAFVNPSAIGWLSLTTAAASPLAPPPYEAPIYDYRDLPSPAPMALGAPANVEDGRDAEDSDADIAIQTFALVRSDVCASFIRSLRPSESPTRYFDVVRGGAVNPAMVAAFLGTAPSLERARSPSRRFIPRLRDSSRAHVSVSIVRSCCRPRLSSKIPGPLAGQKTSSAPLTYPLRLC